MEFCCELCSAKFDNKKSLSTHTRWCKHMNEKYSHIDLEELKHLYYEEKYSIADLSIHYNVGKGLLNFMKNHEIKLRNISESKTERVKEKYSATNIEKYGQPHNFSKNHPSRIKWEKEMLEKEGISNVFLRISVKEQIKTTLVERYGTDHPMRCKEISQKVIETRSKKECKFIRFSSIHKKIVNLLNELHVEHQIEFYLRGDNRAYFYDIKIQNLLIEVNGNYYHANPKFYKRDDIISIHKSLYKVSDIWKLDDEKKKCAIEHGYSMLVLWEDEINSSLETVKEKIYAAIKN